MSEDPVSDEGTESQLEYFSWNPFIHTIVCTYNLSMLIIYAINYVQFQIDLIYIAKGAYVPLNFPGTV